MHPHAFSIPCFLLSIVLLANASAQDPISNNNFEMIDGPIMQAEPSLSMAVAELTEVPIEKFRRSFFQGFDTRAGYLVDWGDAEGGMNQTFQEFGASFGVPLGSLENILALRPFFRATQLDGPTTVDVPATIYDTGVSFFNRKIWTPTLSTTLVVSPTFRSDFTTDDDALRIFGLGLVNWQCRPTFVCSAGVLYLDREDVGILPAIGFVWTPQPDLKINGMLPQPGIAKRLWKDGGAGEGWVSIGGSFGGNTWAVTRQSGTTDQLTLSDYRLLIDYEVIRPGNRGWIISSGYAFARSLEYEREAIELDLDDAWFVEAGLKF